MKTNETFVLRSFGSEKETLVGEKKKNPALFCVLSALGVFLLLCGKPGLTSVGGIIILLSGMSFVIAGFYQLKGIGKCECPYCGETGYMSYSAKQYRCKTCKNTSEVISKSVK